MYEIQIILSTTKTNVLWSAEPCDKTQAMADVKYMENSC